MVVPICSGSNRPSGLSKTGLMSSAGLEDVDRLLLHQRLQALGEGRLAAADRAEQVEDLLALLESLRGMAEEADDALDRLLHAVELGEGRIDPDRPVHEDAAEALVARGVDELRLADGRQQPLRGAGMHQGIVPATLQILAEGEFMLAASFVGARVFGEEIARGQHGGRSFMLRRDNTRARWRLPHLSAEMTMIQCRMHLTCRSVTAS